MKGLLLKDWYQVRTSMKTMYLTVAFVLVIWVFSTSNAYVFPVSYAAIFLGILPVNLLTYDQSVGWVEYGRTLPVSKKTLVAEKYLIGLFCAAAAVVIGGLFVTVIPLRTGTAPDKDVLSLLAGSVCAILLINGISLPLLYRFGAEKARMIYVLTFAGLGALLGGVFGAVSFYDAITGASAMTGALFQVSPVNTFILCVGMRVLMGLCCGLIFSGLKRFDKPGTWSYIVSAMSAPFLNTVFFMGWIVLAFYGCDYVQNLVSVKGAANPFMFVVLLVGVQGVAEFLVSGILGGIVARAVAKFVK